MRNVTFNANESATDGAAALFAGPARLNNVTAAANVSDADANGSGDAAILAQATVQLSNSLLATNIDFSLLIGGNFTPDCAGSPAHCSRWTTTSSAISACPAPSQRCLPISSARPPRH